MSRSDTLWNSGGCPVGAMTRASGQRDGRQSAGRALLLAPVIWLAMVGVLGAEPSPAAPDAGALDRSFSRDGRVITAFPEETGEEEYIEYRLPYEFPAGRLEMAVSPAGQVVVASSKELVRYRPNGQLDLPFGEGVGVSRSPRRATPAFSSPTSRSIPAAACSSPAPRNRVRPAYCADRIELGRSQAR